MALRKKSPNRRRIAREAVRQLSPEHRDAIEISGYGPGDAYIALWDEIAAIKQDQRSVVRALSHPAIKATSRLSIERRASDLRQMFIDTLVSILPYERPRLAMIKFQGDLHGGRVIDITRLNDVRLKQFEEIALILTGAGENSQQGDVADVPQRMATPKGRPRKGEGGEGLRKTPGGTKRPRKPA